MRIHFKNLGQADLYLKTCKQKLADYLKRSSEFRLPTQRVRNAFCQGFGYSSYAELTRVLSEPARELKRLPSEEDFLEAFVKGFSLAFEVSAEYVLSLDVTDHLMAPMIAHSTVEELKSEGSAGELFTQTPGERASELMDEAWSLVQFDGEIPADLLPDAEAKFRAAVTANPDLADAYNGLAFVELSRGNYEAASHHSRTALEKALKDLDTDDPGAYTWYAELITRPYMRARHNLGLSLMRLGDWKGAVREFRELLKRNPSDNQGVRYLIGPLYHLAGDMRHAVPAYRKAAARGDISGDPHNEFNYALALYETGKHEEAVLRIRYGTFRNLHVPQIMLGLQVKRLDIWYGSDHNEPDYAIEYKDEYRPLWEGKKEALAFLRAVYFHPTVRAEIDEYIGLSRQLAQTHGPSLRTPIVDSMFRLSALWRLRENNKEVTSDVSTVAA